jgi:hypothetical protein
MGIQRRAGTAALFTGVFFSGCAVVPRTEPEAAVHISKLQAAIKCELAALASQPQYAPFRLQGWNVKSVLDLTVINTVSADGKLVQTIPYSHGPPGPTVAPALGVTSKGTNIAHVEFASSIPDAVRSSGSECDALPNPSGTGMGLAAWAAATLDSISPENHGGLSYTIEFDVVANESARFGYVLTLVSADAGPSASQEGTNRLTVSMSEPTPEPPPVRVRVINWPQQKVETERPQPKAARPSQPSTGKRPPSATRRPSRSPALNDQNLNRLQMLQAPVRLAPGSVTR